MVQPSPKAQWFGNHTIFLKKKKKILNQPTNQLFSQVILEAMLNLNHFFSKL